MHKTKAVLPVDIARALTVQPQLVQKAVEAFYTRDPIQLRVRPALLVYPMRKSANHSIRWRTRWPGFRLHVLRCALFECLGRRTLNFKVNNFILLKYLVHFERQKALINIVGVTSV